MSNECIERILYKLCATFSDTCGSFNFLAYIIPSKHALYIARGRFGSCPALSRSFLCLMHQDLSLLSSSQSQTPSLRLRHRIYTLPYSWKFWWGIKFGGLVVYVTTAKLKSAKNILLAYIIYVWRSCTKPPNLNWLIFLQ